MLLLPLLRVLTSCLFFEISFFPFHHRYPATANPLSALILQRTSPLYGHKLQQYTYKADPDYIIRSNISTATHRAAAAVAAAAALCMHIKLTSRLLRGHLNQHLTYFYTAKQNKGNATRTKKHHPGFEPRTSRSERQQPTCYPTLSLVRIDRDWYVSICTNRRLGKFDLETKTAPAAGRRREHGRGRPRQSRERREG